MTELFGRRGDPIREGLLYNIYKTTTWAYITRGSYNFHLGLLEPATQSSFIQIYQNKCPI